MSSSASMRASSARDRWPVMTFGSKLGLETRARMRAGMEDRPVAGGSVVFVAAGVEHKFYDIEEELHVLVFFAPAES